MKNINYVKAEMVSNEKVLLKQGGVEPDIELKLDLTVADNPALVIPNKATLSIRDCFTNARYPLEFLNELELLLVQFGYSRYRLIDKIQHIFDELQKHSSLKDTGVLIAAGRHPSDLRYLYGRDAELIIDGLYKINSDIHEESMGREIAKIYYINGLKVDPDLDNNKILTAYDLASILEKVYLNDNEKIVDERTVLETINTLEGLNESLVINKDFLSINSERMNDDVLIEYSRTIPLSDIIIFDKEELRKNGVSEGFFNRMIKGMDLIGYSPQSLGSTNHFAFLNKNTDLDYKTLSENLFKAHCALADGFINSYIEEVKKLFSLSIVS